MQNSDGRGITSSSPVIENDRDTQSINHGWPFTALLGWAERFERAPLHHGHRLRHTRGQIKALHVHALSYGGRRATHFTRHVFTDKTTVRIIFQFWNDELVQIIGLNRGRHGQTFVLMWKKSVHAMNTLRLWCVVARNWAASLTDCCRWVLYIWSVTTRCFPVLCPPC